MWLLSKRRDYSNLVAWGDAYRLARKIESIEPISQKELQRSHARLLAGVERDRSVAHSSMH